MCRTLKSHNFIFFDRTHLSIAGNDFPAKSLEQLHLIVILMDFFSASDGADELFLCRGHDTFFWSQHENIIFGQ